MAKTSEGDIAEVLENLLRDREINETQRNTFLETDFPTVMRTAADSVHTPYSDDAVPLIIRRIQEKAPRFFSSKGLNIPVQTSKYDHPPSSLKLTPENISDAEKLKLTLTKQEFNRKLDVPVSYSHSLVHKTNDYDILGQALTLPQQLRDIYLSLGESRLQAFQSAISMHGNDNDNINVFMKVFEPVDVPIAIGPAIKLVDTGVSVWNYLGFERCGAGRTGETLPDCLQKLHVLLTDLNLKKVSEDTGIDKRTLERIKRGEIKIRYKDAKKLEHYLPNQKGIESANSPVRLVKETPYVFFISRAFPSSPQSQATEPQIHTSWEGDIIYGWNKATEYTESQAAPLKTSDARITKERLQRYRPAVLAHL